MSSNERALIGDMVVLSDRLWAELVDPLGGGGCLRRTKEGPLSRENSCEEKLEGQCLNPFSRKICFFFFIRRRKFRVPQKEVGKRSSITCFRFWDSFGHFLVTFSDASVTFFVTVLPNSFCRTPFAAG